MIPRLAALVLISLCLSSPSVAQEPERDGFEEGLDLFSEGARRFMQEFAGELGPLLLQLEALMDEITAYQAPEILDNGDIIIRRRPDTPETPGEPADPEGDSPIEL